MGVAKGALGCCANKDKAPIDLADKVKFMKAVSLFGNLTDSEMQQLGDACGTASYGKHTVIYHEGDYGTEMFIIAAGTVGVHVDGIQAVAELSVGDHFGEMALLRDCPRTSTITTETTVEVMKIHRAQFHEMELHHKLDFNKTKQAAIASRSLNITTLAPSKKTEEDVKTILHAIKSNKNLTKMVDIDDEQRQMMCDSAWEQVCETGEAVINQGEQTADYFYIIKSGSCEVDIETYDVNKQAKTCSQAIESHIQQVGTISTGGSFGELALIYNAPRAATIKALEPVVLWVIDRNTFKRACARKADHYAKKYAAYLNNSEAFANLTDAEKLKLGQAMLESNFEKDEHIFEQGEEGSRFYVLYDGEVAAFQDGSDEELVRLQGSEERPEIFGELALMSGDTYGTTITVVSETAKTLSIDKETFDFLLGVEAALSENADKQERRKASTKLRRGAYAAKVISTKALEQIYLCDLKSIGLLGCGGFGYVELVEHNVSKHAFALKKLSKGYIVEMDQTEEVMMEKDIQMKCDSDFIIRLYETFVDEQHLYFLLELGIGGELYHTYQLKNFWGKPDHAKFYTASVTYALEHMHRKKMIYRDLKPENVLFNSKGFAKLTDMGLATICIGKTTTTCGTPGYMAPEVISGDGHNHSVDWWTLGVLTFELMVGHGPFEAPTQVQIFEKIKDGIAQVKFPSNTNPLCKRYIKKMCHHDPAQRLPMKKGGAENIRSDAWYEGFEWDALKSQTLQPPYVPAVKSEQDLGNFKCKDEEKPPHIEYVDDGSGWDKDFASSTFERP